MSNLNDFVIEDSILKKYVGPGGDAVIPDGVTSICDFAFGWCKSLTSVTIPDSVTSIRNSAFYGCRSMTRVDITDVAVWCKISFEDYYSNPLLDVHDLYLNGELVTDLQIPDTITSIGNYAFAGCSLTSVTIPDSVTSVGNFAFSGCSSLTSVTIPDSMTNIGNSAFSGCSSLTGVTIPDSVTSVGNFAFSGCSSLTGVTIPDGVTSIGEKAFYGCSSLVSVKIPDSVTSIGNSVFCDCESLTSVTIPDSVTSIEKNAFYGCRSLMSVKIPDSVTSIGDSAFSWCESLTSVTIPDSVTSIGDSAFSCCRSLTSVTIPDSVTSIGHYAFSGCSSLARVMIQDISRLPAEYRQMAVACFADDGGATDDPRYKSHCKYIKANAAKLSDLAIEHPALLSLMCREKLITPKNLELYMEAVQKSKDAELIAMMLDYSAAKITIKQKENLEKQKEKEQNKIIDRMISRQNKEGIDGLSFVVTGKLATFDNREAFKMFVAAHGGKLVSAMSASVDYLILNDPSSDSTKTQRAKELGVTIIDEKTFLKMAEE